MSARAEDASAEGERVERPGENLKVISFGRGVNRDSATLIFRSTCLRADTTIPSGQLEDG
jgi:hypothetical protein